MSWIKVFASQLRNPITDLIVTRCDEAILVAVEGMTNGEGRVAAVPEFRKV